MKDFSQRLDYDIPSDLQEIVLGIIRGKTKRANTIADQPMFATGFPLLVFSQGVVPHFNVNGQNLIPKSSINVAGQIFEASVLFSINGMMDNIGIILNPMATYYLFHKPGSYFLNSWTSLDSELGIDSKPLYRELSRDLDVEQKIGSMLEFIRILSKNRLPPIDWLDQTVSKIFETNGNIDQSTLAAQSGIGLRHFRRVFKNIIGMPPKYYCKVIQINTFFELLNRSATEKLHHLALDCGYYDQSHFIRDFIKFIGESPEKFLNGEHAYIKTYLGRHS